MPALTPWLMQACMKLLGKGEAKEIPEAEIKNLLRERKQDREFDMDIGASSAQTSFPSTPHTPMYASSQWTQQSFRFFIPSGNTTAVGTITLILVVVTALIQ